MRNKREPIHKTITPRTLEASLDYEYLKTKNNDFCKEIAELRKDKMKQQADIDYLLREKFNIELKYNQLYHSFSNIVKRSKICLRSMVECSTELSHIINQVKMLDDRLSDSPVGTNKTSNTSFKQVVTPHAVNGHVIHTPTIRIARYSESSTRTDPRCSINNVVEQNYEDDNSTSEEESHQNKEDDENEEDQVLTEEDAPQNDYDDTQMETDEKLPTIQEELEELSDVTEGAEDQPVFSGRFEEVRKSNQLSESFSSVVPEATTSFDSTTRFDESFPSQVQKDKSYFDDHLGSQTPKKASFVLRKSIGSPIPSKIARRSIKRRRSTNISQSSPHINPSTTPHVSENFRRSSTSSLSEADLSSESTLKNSRPQDHEERSQDSEGPIAKGRKSIGSPIPSKIARRSIKRRRFTNISESSPPINPSTPSQVSENFRRSSASSLSESDLPSESTLKNSRPQDQEERSQDSEGPIAKGETDTSDAVIQDTVSKPTRNSFIGKNSIHSTPLFDSSNTSSTNDIVTPFLAKVNIRRNRLKEPAVDPIVQLTRLEFSQEEAEHFGVHLMKCPKPKKKLKASTEKVLINQQIKREKSHPKNRRVESKGNSSSCPQNVIVPKVKREKLLDSTDATNLGGRPKRAAKPTLLKEASLNKKMRRSR